MDVSNSQSSLRFRYSSQVCHITVVAQTGNTSRDTVVQQISPYYNIANPSTYLEDFHTLPVQSMSASYE